MKISIERTAERPAARPHGGSRAIVQHTTCERLEIDASYVELEPARDVVSDFLRRTNKRFSADQVADFELAVLQRSPVGPPIDQSAYGDDYDDLQMLD